MSIEKTISQIRFEMGQIDKLNESFEILLKKCKISEPDIIETAAAASWLHSFYNGVENIFLSIAKHVDKTVPQGQQWHRDLLKQMNQTVRNRHVEVISKESMIFLSEYMGFRHFYRHSYSFLLKWPEMKRLVFNLETRWDAIKRDINAFIKEYEKTQ